MSFFEHLMKLNELQVNGQQVDDNDDFDVEDETPDTDETPAPTDAPTDTADAAADNEENAPETTAETTDNEDDFTLDDNDEAMDDTTDDTADDGAQEPETTGDTGGGDENTGDDDFSVDTSDEGGGETPDTGVDSGEADNTGNTGDNSTENKAPEDPTDGVSDEEQRASEEQMYDSLTDDQKRIRVLQLKIDYKDLYETFNTTLDGISNIPKTNDNLETLKRLNILLNKAKDILISYIQNNFDQNTYLENYTMYLKYMAVFRTASRVIDGLGDMKDGGKK